ncbi:hypothetical protein P12x_000083 [Tundrisphaera lichenicola]|uniref:hypothetical protein n=1 Tax=Tundrisphaera lichenicola TaxID=2029860 RepID=UPI003EBC483D
MTTNPGAGSSTPGAEGHRPDPADVEGRTLFVVVHGLGESALGATVREVARGLTNGDRALEMIEETHWVPGPDRVKYDGHSVRAFPVPVLRDRNGSLVIAEVHWADLSNFPVNLFGLVPGFFTVLFGLRYIAYQAVDGLGDPGAKALRWIVRAATGMLIGPLAATSLLLLCLVLGAAILDQPSGAFYRKTPEGDYVAGLCALGALLSGALLTWRLHDNQVLCLIGASLRLVALALLGAVFIGLAVHHLGFPRDRWHFFGEGIISYIVLVATKILFPVIVVISSLLLTSLFVLIRMAIASRDRSLLTSAGVAASVPFVMTMAWSIVVPISWAAVGQALRLSPCALHDLYRPFEANPMLLTWLLSLLIVLLVVVVVPVLFRWSRRSRKPGLVDDGARLIVNPWIQWGFVATYSTACLLVILEKSGLIPTLPKTRILVAIMAFLGSLGIIAQLLRSGLYLIHDVVNHFFFRFRDVDERASEAKPPPFTVRRAIEDRLNATLDHFAERLGRDEEGPPWRLIVLSHSQGTVLAIEALNNPSNEVDQFGDVRLVTKGSPFSHIYQHYFRHHYPLLSNDRWSTLRRRLAPRYGGRPRWLNIFRIDDYVGRSIDDSVPGLIANVAIGPGGHLGYWDDPDVIRHIESVIGFQPPGPVSGRPPLPR